MADVSKDNEISEEELMERDALALAELIYDIYQEKKSNESNSES